MGDNRLDALWMFVGIVAIGSFAFTGGAIADGVDSQDPNEIDDCTIIESSGEYVLTDDIEYDGGACIEIRAVEGVEVDGQGHVLSGEFGTGIEIQHSADVTVKNVAIDGGYFNGMLVAESTNLTIAGNEIDAGDQGISIRDGSAEILIDQNTVTTERDTGIFSSDSSEITITNNSVGETGINSIRVGDGSTNILIHGNEVNNSGAIMAWEASDVEITANNVDRVQYGINVREGSSDVVVRNNVVTNTSHCAFDVKTNSRNVLIEDNYAYNHSGIGLEDNVTSVTIRNNVVEEGHGTEGQYFGSIHAVLSSTEITISNNTIIDSTKDGIHVSGWNETSHTIEIHNNVITGASNYGIFLDSSTYNVEATENLLFDNTADVEDRNPAENIVEDTLFDSIQGIGGDIENQQVAVGELVSVEAAFENLAPEGQSYEVRFEIDGEPETTEEVEIPAETVKSVGFEHVFDEPGDYEIRLNEVEVGLVTVEPAEEPTEDEAAEDESDAVDADDDSITQDQEDQEDHEDGDGPGFGIGPAIAGIVVLVGIVATRDLLKRRM